MDLRHSHEVRLLETQEILLRQFVRRPPSKCSSVRRRMMDHLEITFVRIAVMCLRKDQLLGVNYQRTIDVLPVEPRSFDLRRYPRVVRVERLK